MKKISLSICALLVVASMCITACDTGSPDESGDESAKQTVSEQESETKEESESETDTDTEKETGAQRVQIPITNGKKLNYRLVYPSTLGEDGRDAVKEFIPFLTEKLGSQPALVADTTQASSDIKEIIIGAGTREKSVTPESYASYGVKTYEDGTIAIYGSNGTMLKKAFATFSNGLSKMQDGNYYYRGYEYVDSSLSDLLASLPVADFGYVETVYESHKNVYQVSVKGATSGSLAAYSKTLVAAGYSLYSSNTIDANNVFATYKNAESAVHVGYHKSNATVEIIIEKLGYLPPASPVSAAKKVTPTITQMKLADSEGMSYVIQLSDGTFVVIDGGISSSTYSKELIDYLEIKNEGTGYAKPQVTWMFTHSHPDHIQLAEGFIVQYASRFDLVTLCANFIELNTDYSSSFSDTYGFTNLINNAKGKFPNVNIFTFHTGQAMYLAGCKIDFYLTHEDIYPIKLGTLNSASSVWKFTFDGGKTFMILGDTTETGSEILNSYYGGTLKSDIMQAAHHGVNASNGTAHLKALYANINPTTVMWANSNESKVRAFAANSDLLAKSGLVSIYSSQIKSLDI